MTTPKPSLIAPSVAQPRPSAYADDCQRARDNGAFARAMEARHQERKRRALGGERQRQESELGVDRRWRRQEVAAEKDHEQRAQ
jgi:hypothetical protein